MASCEVWGNDYDKGIRGHRRRTATCLRRHNPASGRRIKAALRAVACGRLSPTLDAPPARMVPAPAGKTGEKGQAELSCLASWLVTSTLRGLADSCTGMDSVSTPAV
jgi:hypothetical protein